jgi:hypothetical protein
MNNDLLIPVVQDFLGYCQKDKGGDNAEVGRRKAFLLIGMPLPSPILAT